MAQFKRVVRCLDFVLEAVNKAYPGRSKASDGSLGDQAHAARKSDHNPDENGIVHARDFTEWDPNTPTVDLDDVAEALVNFIISLKPAWLKYMIWRGRIMSGFGGPSPWIWRKYTGANGHFKHAHISAKSTAEADGAIKFPFKKPGARKDGLRPGDAGKAVEFLEALLNILIPYRMNAKGVMKAKRIKEDGWYEGETSAGVAEFQRFCNAFWKLTGSTKRISVNGVADNRTLGLIAEWVKVAQAK